MQKVYDGLFTVNSPKGGHRTFRVRTQKDNAKFAPGERIVSLLTGPDNTWGSADYRGFGFVKADGRLVSWKRHRGTDTEKAGMAFLALALQTPLGEKMEEHGYELLEERRCCRCGRTLTDPESIETGIGPVCREKL